MFRAPGSERTWSVVSGPWSEKTGIRGPGCERTWSVVSGPWSEKTGIRGAGSEAAWSVPGGRQRPWVVGRGVVDRGSWVEKIGDRGQGARGQGEAERSSRTCRLPLLLFPKFSTVCARLRTSSAPLLLCSPPRPLAWPCLCPFPFPVFLSALPRSSAPLLFGPAALLPTSTCGLAAARGLAFEITRC